MKSSHIAAPWLGAALFAAAMPVHAGDGWFAGISPATRQAPPPWAAPAGTPGPGLNLTPPERDYRRLIGYRFNRAFAMEGSFGLDTGGAATPDGSLSGALAPIGAVGEGSRLKFGLGLRYELSDSTTLRVDWDRYRNSSDPLRGGDLGFDFNYYGAGLQLRF